MNRRNVLAWEERWATPTALAAFAAVLFIVGAIVVAMVYTCLYAMRVGLLPRFWGSLGMALGAVSFLFFQFTLLWFIYFGILLLRRDSQPPAWAAGEPVPWPTAGDKAAAAMESSPDDNGSLPPQLEEPSEGLPQLEDPEDPTGAGRSQ